MKKRFLDSETLRNAINMLQPVTPTNKEYPAHWYNEGYGQQVYNQQKIYLDNLKEQLSKVKTKVEIWEVINKNKNKSLIPELRSNEEVKFWSEGFGLEIFIEYREMFNSFVGFINNTSDMMEFE